MGDGTSSSNAFLRNLSQKKYSWMQPSAQLSPATNTTTPATPATTTTPTDASLSTSANATTSTPISKKETSNESKRASAEDSNRTPKKPRHGRKRSVEEDSRKPVQARSNGNSRSLSPAATMTPAGNNNTTATSSSVIPSRSPSPTLELPADDDALLAPRRNRVKRSQPRFRYTSFPVKGFSILPTRNITSGFDRTDTSYFPGNKAGSSSIAPNVSMHIIY